VRDEILTIMHRHHIKEIAGHFLEQWHQKLHNNTTPDDVVLCEAYCAFLESGGSREVFYERLQKGGVTRERLAGYERPITAAPEYFGHIRDPLLHDFRNFLRILKGVHAGTDLESAAAAARGLLDHDRARDLDRVLQARPDPEPPLAGRAAAVLALRAHLHDRLRHCAGAEQRRDLLFLDLALEDHLRVAAEAAIGRHQPPDSLVDLLTPVLDNLCLAGIDDELPLCAAHWRWLAEHPRRNAAWALQAHAAVERLARVAAGHMQRLQQRLQPPAERLGRACGVEPWAVELFAEEVCRGQFEFVVSLLVRQLTGHLRGLADLGPWQIISHGQGRGRVEVVAGLRELEGGGADMPLVVLAGAVAGDEDIPSRVTAIVTPEGIDLLSHVAIRARNAGVLLATCYSEAELARLTALRGRQVRVRAGPGGGMRIDELPAARDTVRSGSAPPLRLATPRPCDAWVIAEADFSPERVGAKAGNLVRLKAALPEWIAAPASIALPFGTFEKTLADARNRETALRWRELIGRLDAPRGGGLPELLAALRATVRALLPPDALCAQLLAAAAAAGMRPWGDGRAAWECITRVWASLWNDRAQASRAAFGISPAQLSMAVLIQPVIEADYSFVVHTVNPVSGDAGELYAEVVPGLGETLVGNHPGRALGFTCAHAGGEPTVVSYPGKSRGLFGGGVIFRSDSNAEDLHGYAGAGLYDSVMLPAPEARLLDYRADPLVTDEAFRTQILARIAETGSVVARLTDAAQDIEGCVRGGRVHVVQTRHQAGVAHGRG
jgi:alpha-glucan,water dikinase